MTNKPTHYIKMLRNCPVQISPILRGKEKPHSRETQMRARKLALNTDTKSVVRAALPGARHRDAARDTDLPSGNPNAQPPKTHVLHEGSALSLPPPA